MSSFDRGSASIRDGDSSVLSKHVLSRVVTSAGLAESFVSIVRLFVCACKMHKTLLQCRNEITSSKYS